MAKVLADERGVRVTAMLREIVYAALSQIRPETYDAAKLADEEAWKESVRKRVEGRMRSRQEKDALAGDA